MQSPSTFCHNAGLHTRGGSWLTTTPHCDARRCQVVYSSQDPVLKLQHLSQGHKDAPQEYGAVDNFRTGVLPVLGTRAGGRSCRQLGMKLTLVAQLHTLCRDNASRVWPSHGSVRVVPARGATWLELDEVRLLSWWWSNRLLVSHSPCLSLGVVRLPSFVSSSRNDAAQQRCCASAPQNLKRSSARCELGSERCSTTGSSTAQHTLPEGGWCCCGVEQPLLTPMACGMCDQGASGLDTGRGGV